LLCPVERKRMQRERAREKESSVKRIEHQRIYYTGQFLPPWQYY